ncbi:MAG: hypothetical protein HQL82_12005 [Magnetococcales bacterium]|nr:hypothetical protein [Magnetococcales bacterium]
MIGLPPSGPFHYEEIEQLETGHDSPLVGFQPVSSHDIDTVALTDIEIMKGIVRRNRGELPRAILLEHAVQAPQSIDVNRVACGGSGLFFVRLHALQQQRHFQGAFGGQPQELVGVVDTTCSFQEFGILPVATSSPCKVG